MAGSPKKRLRRAQEAAESAAAAFSAAMFSAAPDAPDAPGEPEQTALAIPETKDLTAEQAEVLPAPADGTPIFATAEEFQKAADEYFQECDACGRLYGEAGLCLWLSSHNRGRRRVTLDTLRRWYDGDRCAYLQEEVQMAYLRIQDQVETDPRYQTKTMTTRAIFVQKQTRLGGYQDKIEEKTDSTVRIILGDGVSAESFG